MGVVHSMDDGQVQRVSSALKESAQAIQGINSKFDVIDEHWKSLQDFNTKINSKVKDSLSSFQRLDSTFNSKFEVVLENVENATNDLTLALEFVLSALERFDVRREMNQLPKAFIPLSIPLIILLIELAVANAYLGILLSSVPEIGGRYSTYLLANASSVLLGLMLSLVWLGVYRAWLSHKTRRKKSQNDTQDDEEFREQRVSQRDQQAPSHCTSSNSMNPEDQTLAQPALRIPADEIYIRPVCTDFSSESDRQDAHANASIDHLRPPPIETDGYVSQHYESSETLSPEVYRAKSSSPVHKTRSRNSPKMFGRQGSRQRLGGHKEGVGDNRNFDPFAQASAVEEPQHEAAKTEGRGFGPRKNWRWRTPFEMQVMWTGSKTQEGGSSSSGLNHINQEYGKPAAERVPHHDDPSGSSSAAQVPHHTEAERVPHHDDPSGSSSVTRVPHYTQAERVPHHDDPSGSSSEARVPHRTQVRASRTTNATPQAGDEANSSSRAEGRMGI